MDLTFGGSFYPVNMLFLDPSVLVLGVFHIQPVWGLTQDLHFLIADNY